MINFNKRFGRGNKSVIEELIELINEGRVVMLGLIRQELLSGVKSEKDFIKLRDNLYEMFKRISSILCGWTKREKNHQAFQHPMR